MPYLMNLSMRIIFDFGADVIRRALHIADADALMLFSGVAVL